MPETSLSAYIRGNVLILLLLIPLFYSNQNMEAIQAYYNESQESTAGLVNTTVMQLSEV